MILRPLALALAIAWAVASAAVASEPAPGLPFSMPTPEGWRTETIPFPLSFAPGLPYQGLEELRFSPGMFRPEDEDYFSYGFLWLTKDPLDLDPAALAADLRAYFEGLGHAVRQSKKLEPVALDLPTRLAPTVGGRALVGTSAAFDAFAAQAEVNLNVRVHRVAAPAGYRGALYFALSPQPLSHPVWDTLSEIGAGYAPRAVAAGS